MTQFFSKKLNKKGFTLAELLIVVAIIAVMIGIAVPIFTGALERAEKATFEANQRAIKSAGVASMLADPNFSVPTASATWYASATIDANGDITSLEVSTTNPGTGSHDWTEWGNNNKTGAIIATIKSTDLDTTIS